MSHDDIGAGLDVQGRLFPVNTVVAGGVTGLLGAAEIPHLEEILVLVVEHAAAQINATCRLRTGFDQRVGGMLVGRMERKAHTGGVLDQVPVYEQLRLITHVDGRRRRADLVKQDR